MNEDKLKALKDLEAPPPSEAARAKALAAAMAAFDAAQKENYSEAQGNGGPARLTLASSQTQRKHWMRASSTQLRIAASIGVLVLATPMAVHLWQQDKTPALPAKEAGNPALSAEAVPAQAGKTSFESQKTIHERFTPAPGDTGAASAPPTSPVAQAPSLEARIDEALRKAPGSGAPSAGQPGTHTEARPVVTPDTVSADQRIGLDSVPAAPQVAAVAPKPAPAPSDTHQTAGPGNRDKVLATPVAGEAPKTFQFGPAPSFGGSGAYHSERARAKLGEKQAQATGVLHSAPPPDGVYDLSIAGYGAPGLQPGVPVAEPESRDKFEPFASSPVKQVAAEPVSTFSIDVDTASYGFVRRSLMAGRTPPRDAVRVEEMINYFPYNYPRPEGAAAPFQPTVTVTPAPWKPTNKLVHIGIKGYDIAAKERPRANLVFLIDVSGSMAPDDRLPLLKNAFRMLLDELKPDDTVGIVTYASHSGIALEPTRVAERAKIADVISRLHAGGSTAGGDGLQNAYKLAEAHFYKNSVNRIILATDGDFNVGISDHEQLKHFIEGKRRSGIYLSVIGVGQDNYNDRMMQALAQNGNGVAAYVDTLNEARKVLVDEASSTLFTIAKDVKIQIEFNPAQVSEYRLIGYETRALKREDFNNDKIDAGEIGSGHTVTAIYEVTPVGAPKFVDDLRYGKPQAQAPQSQAPAGELGFLKIRYKLPAEDVSKLIMLPIAAGREDASIQDAPEDVRFSIAVAAFGQLLRSEPYTGSFNFDSVLALAQTARGADPFGYRAEFLNLVRLAKSTHP
jgi:Ca-activated chloride channel homolog